MKILKQYLANLIEYHGTGSWIYNKRILAWTSDTSIVRQLPAHLRVFCHYARAYNYLVGTRTIILGHAVYRCCRAFGRRGTDETARIEIAGQPVWLNLADPGSMWAIQEITTPSTLPSLVASLTRDADLFVDVGANQGIFSAIVSRTMRVNGGIIAIEPQKEMAKCLELTLRASKIKRWKVIKSAVSDHCGTMSLVVPLENRGEAHLGVTTQATATGATTDVTTLDKILAEQSGDQQVIVKMDIEGAELAALRGGREFFTRCAPTLILEINPTAMVRYDHTIGALAKILAQLGYTHWADPSRPHEQRDLDALPNVQCDIVLFGKRFKQ